MTRLDFVKLLGACLLVLGCTRHSSEQDASGHEAARVVALVQTGRLREHDRGEEGREYSYSEARYDQAGQLMDRVIYRRDETRVHLREYENGQIRSVTTFDDEGREADYVLRFVYEEADRLVEIRYCATAELNCPAWRVDVVETWTPTGLPLHGSVRWQGLVLAIDWRYDAKGRLIEKKLAATSWSFEYDDHDRLIGWDASFPGSGEGGTRVFEYDDAGRLVRELEVGAWSPVGAMIEYSYVQVTALRPGVEVTGVEDLTQSHGSVN